MIETKSKGQDLWGGIAPCEHVVQIYEEDDRFLDSLEAFVLDGLADGESIVAIATATHLHFLEERLRARGVSINIARARGQYIPLDARETLAKFMVAGWPDEALFNAVVGELLATARGDGRRVRAFGEMVALMWADGLTGAVVRLEQLWHALCARESFPLFCAYPKSGFTEDADESVRAICAAHSRVLGEDESVAA
jgi:hypothetical protein